MLVPLWTSTKIRRTPLVVGILVVLNVLFFVETSGQLQVVAKDWGLAPLSNLTDSLASLERFKSGSALFTYAFLHASWFHLLVNLWFLIVFGCPTESRIGSIPFGLLYLLLAVLARFAQAAFDADPIRLVIGASGAISGILGCHLALCPRSRFLSFVFLGFFGFVCEIPGVVYVAIWLLLQWDGIQRRIVGDLDCDNIAWWAHIGGLVAGIGIGLALRLVLPNLGPEKQRVKPLETLRHPRLNRSPAAETR